MTSSLAVNDIQAKSANSVFEVMGDTADMVRRQKKVERKWDPAKRKYVTENNKEKMIRSESGGWIPLSYRSGKYEKWQEKNKATSMQEGNDDENDGQMPRPSQGKNSTSRFCLLILHCLKMFSSLLRLGSMRLNTHWGKHNLKVFEKERAKPMLDMNLERILKQRKIKEKRKARNQRARKTKKTKVKKKSAKFNKV